MAHHASTSGCVAWSLRRAGIALVVFGVTLGSIARAQTANEWTWMGGSNNGYAPSVNGTEGTFAPANIPGSRQKVPTWTDASGNVWIFGGDNYNDVWKFNPATNQWAWMAGNASGGSAQPGVYGTIGVAASANVPGSRYGALTWMDNSGNLWLFGGVGTDANGTQGDLNDMWEFSPTTLLWTWMGGSSTIPGNGGVAGVYGVMGTPAAGNYPGSRNTSATWTDKSGNFWLFAGYGYDSNGNNLTLSDLWEFNPPTLQWTWMGGRKTGNAAAVYGTLGTPASGNIPGGRGNGPLAWVDKGGNFWLFGGEGIGASGFGYLNDLWQFNPSTGQWTWMSGSSTVGSYCVPINGYTNCGQSGVYGTLGTPSSASIPGARASGSNWIDSSDNLWLFGGMGYDANGDGGYLNDLWEYNTFTNEWTWMSGSSTVTDNSGPLSVFGTLGTQAAGNSPGGRNSTTSWTDSSGNLWLFAGYGIYGTGNLSELNEVWQYQPPSSSLPAAATPTFSPASGTYTTLQTVTISDTTPGATIYYTTNGTAPTINSSVYSGAITVTSPESIEAIAVAGSYSNSAVAAAYYNVNLPIAATPTFSLASGTYMGAPTVTISDATPGATIYYAINGTPTTGSTVYSGPITILSTETLNAIAVEYEYASSAVATAAYTITPLAATTPGEWTWVAGGTSWNSGVWGTLGTPAPANIPGVRQSAATWTDPSGHFWLFGGLGNDINWNGGDLNDLWEYNPAANLWTWVSGSSTLSCGSNGCSQPGVYGTLGTPAAGNTPGGRQQASTWIDSSGNLWLFGGSGTDANGNQGDLNDLWMFNSSTSLWTWMGGSSTVGSNGGQSGVYGTLGTAAPGNTPGGRTFGLSWTDKSGHFWLFGGSGYDSVSTNGALNDVWEFNPSTKEWTWMGGSKTAWSPGVYGTLGTPSAGNIPGVRVTALSWTDGGGNFWLFGGWGFDANGQSGFLNDLWEFNPSTNQWTWISGSKSVGSSPCENSNSALCGQIGVYGTQGTPAAGNVPGSRTSSSTWADSSGNLWLFAGTGFDSTGAFGDLNELWEFSPFTNEWTWMGGNNVVGSSGGQPGVYGTLGVPAPGNIPGARTGQAAWTGSNSNLWLMGGCGFDISDAQACFNDLWEYQPAATVSSPAATPSFSLAPGNYNTIQTLTISDATPGATIYYTTNGTAPTINSAVYSGPITISSPEVFEAIATAGGYSNSAVATAVYNVVVPATATPTISLASGTYDQPQTVTISDATPGATIYYAINGTPTTSSAAYSGPITVSSTETLQAIALAPGDSVSGVASASYTDTLPAATSAGEWTWVGGNKTVGSSPGYSGVYGTLGTPAPGNIPGARSGEVSWTDKSGNLWLFGGLGFDINGGTSAKRLNDVWMLSPSTNEWTWMGGSTTNQASAVCGTMGTPAAGNIPGARYSPNSWTDSSGNFWLFGGSGYDCNGNEGPLNDLWKLNPTTNLWTWVGGSSTNTEAGVYGTLGVPAAGNIPGSRENGMSWTDSSGNLWLFGGQGLDSTSNTTKGYLNDLWMFNPATKLWTWMGGSNVDGNVGSTVGPTPGVYGTLDTPAPGNVPSGREYANAWSDSGGNLWLFGGDNKSSSGSTIYLNDLWEFNTTTNEWTWVSGSSASGGDQNGVYGSEGTPAPTNAPGSRTTASSWTDSSGNFWLLGGQGYDHGTGEGYLNDLWEFNPPTSEWTWIAGSNTRGPGGTYGTLGMPSSTNAPGVRYNPASWRDSIGNFWIFGGEGKDANATFANLNDLWEYRPAATLPPTATPTFSVPAGSYTSVQTVTINDATAGATIYCTTNGTAPNINSPVCSGPITVSSTETLEAIAVASGDAPSMTATAAYMVILPTATPTISLASGSYDQLQTVTLSDATPGAIIYYAINATPTTGSTVYSGPITVSSTETLEAIALAGGYSTSAVATASYTVTLPPVATGPGEWTWVSGSNVVGNGSWRPGVYGSLGTPASSNVPGSRTYPNTWTDSSGHLWLFGGFGYDTNGGHGRLNDLWEFDSTTNLWTWMGGSKTMGASGVYGSQGVAAAGSIPGARNSAATWMDSSGNLWLFGGYGSDASGVIGYLSDLWEFNPSTKLWTWMAGSASHNQPGVYGTLGAASALNIPGGREYSASWTDKSGNHWLFGGTGPDSTGTIGYLNDLWEFNPSTNEWTWMGGSSSLGCAVSYCAGLANYGTLGTPALGNTPGGRISSASWTDSGGNFWLFGGYVQPVNGNDKSTELNDLWEFNPSTNTWTWMGGSSLPAGNQSGNYGAVGTPAPSNLPGGRDSVVSWTDHDGNFWLFGGFGFNGSGGEGYLGDLWEFSPFTNEWTWMVGSNTNGSGFISRAGVYGTLGVPGASNVPGSRGNDAGWIDSSGNFWLFGGVGRDANGASGTLNDLWVYQPTLSSLPPAATPTFSVPAGSYTSVQTVTINDATAGATIYCTTNGTAPNINSPVCSGPITVSSTETLEAIAVASGDAPSLNTTAAYTINLPVTPTITWATPAAITYGTALSGTQLNASSAVAGTYAYSPAPGTVLTVGTQTLSVTFTPTDTTDYTTATATVQLTVNQATPTINWSNPSPITYGTALSATQLDAASTASGAYVYSPAIGTVQTAGTQTLSVTFTPTDTTDYTTATATVQLTVNQATPTITWATPAPINYGTALSGTQLDASASVPGALVYSPAAGNVPEGGSQSLSVTFTPTDTTDYATATASVTLTVNPIAQTITFPALSSPVTYGVGPIALSATASSTLAVTFSATGPATVSGNTLIITGAGPVVVTASQAGNNDYSAATPVSRNLTVSKATPASILNASETTGSYGDSVMLTATLTGGDVPPSGTVTFRNGGSSIGTGTLSGGVATLTTTSLPAGGDSLTATYTGDSNYKTATSNTVTVTLNLQAQSISFALPSPVTFGVSPITLSATATSGLAVTFSATGPATLSNSKLTITGAGTVVVTASQAGNANYSAATSVPQTLIVNQATPTVTWANPAAITYGTALSATQLKARASVPGTFAYNPAAGTVLGAGTQTLSVTFTPTDTTDYTTATGTATLVVNPAATTITWSNPAAITYGTALGTTQLNASSTVTGTYVYTPPAGTVLTVGSQTLSVTLTPDDTTDYTAATKTVTINVKQAKPTITWTTPASISYGTPLGAAQQNATASADGTFAYSPAAGTVLGVGTHNLSVTFTPTDTTDYSNATATVSQTVTIASQTINFTAPPSPVVYGVAPIALSATASSGLTVKFTILSGPGTISGSTLTITGAGTVVVAANQAGNADYTAAAQVTQTVVVTQATPGITLTSSAATITHGSSVTFTATLTGGSTKPTGTVIFFDGATQLGTGTLNGSGVGKYTTTTLAVGGHSITASYGGDTNYLTVTSTAVGVTVQ